MKTSDKSNWQYILKKRTKIDSYIAVFEYLHSLSHTRP